jgi:hypothetical protein
MCNTKMSADFQRSHIGELNAKLETVVADYTGDVDSHKTITVTIYKDSTKVLEPISLTVPTRLREQMEGIFPGRILDDDKHSMRDFIIDSCVGCVQHFNVDMKFHTAAPWTLQKTNIDVGTDGTHTCRALCSEKLPPNLVLSSKDGAIKVVCKLTKIGMTKETWCWDNNTTGSTSKELQFSPPLDNNALLKRIANIVQATHLEYKAVGLVHHPQPPHLKCKYRLHH